MLRSIQIFQMSFFLVLEDEIWFALSADGSYILVLCLHVSRIGFLVTKSVSLRNTQSTFAPCKSICLTDL